MEFTRITIIITLLALSMPSCNKKENNAERVPVYASEQFHDYWHAGKAEVNSYNLDQSRYGESRPGKAVLIFATEDQPAGKLADQLQTLNFKL